ncbi:MAG TPA: PAS domain S-box protein [Chitinophagaceae bacterium]
MKDETADQTLLPQVSLYNILEAFLAGTSDSFIVLDQERNIVLFNDNFREFIHCATGKTLLQSLPLAPFLDCNESLSVVGKALDKSFTTGETLKFSFSITCASKRWYDAELHPLKQGRNVIGLGIGLFETTHKREAEESKRMADEALVKAEQRLTMLLNNTKESFIILNNALKVVAYNKAAQEHSPFFFNSELQSGLSLLDLVPASEAACHISMMEKVLEGEEQERETCFMDAEGQVHYYRHDYRRLNQGSEGYGIFITSTDITERKIAALELKENEEKFKTIIEYSYDAIAIIDGTGMISYISPSVKHLLGFEPEEMVGKSGFEFIHPDDRGNTAGKLAALTNHPEIEHRVDYRSITRDGSYKWLEAKGKNMSSNKHINGILVSLRDISDRKKLLDEQTVLATELTKYNKDLQQFSFITSHNLRAPVANLMGLLALYNQDDPADPTNVELIDKFHECTRKLNDTLNDLINVLVIRSRPNADLEYIRFEDVLHHVQRNIDGLVKASGGTISFDFSAAEGVEYNRVHMESIFMNLISNAVKYAEPQRRLVISVRSEQTEQGVRLIVKDNGIGIDLDRYGERMFGLYQRFHSGKDGKGLGLYMIKSQITASGGKIEVDSEPGAGSSFKVTFPQPRINS